MLTIHYSIAIITLTFLAVGCDGIINGQQYDVCGICGGDNSTCRLISGLFTKPFLTPGYNYIADIPEHACNLNISSTKRTNNFFALRSKNGIYVVNENSFSGTDIGTTSTYAVGTVFTYHRAKNGEFIFAAGPISQPVKLFLLYRQMNAGIKYEYRVPVSSVPVKKHHVARELPTYDSHDNVIHDQSPSTTARNDPINDQEFKPHSNSAFTRKRENKFNWKITSYTPCSRSCGEGTRIGIYSCVREDLEEHIVADRKCSNQVKKPENPVLPCVLSACSAEWMTGEWGPCSVNCSEGIEKRDLLCVRVISDRQKMHVNEEECAARQPANVLRTRPCFRKPCGSSNATSIKPYWKTGTWSMCSVRCGIGVKSRMVKCIAESDDECIAAERPLTETICDTGPCTSEALAQWLTTEWSTQCTEKCGTGIQTRRAACLIGTTDGCGQNLKPETSRNCSSKDLCKARWFVGPWSSCSTECGWGKQSRSLACLGYETSSGSYSVMTEENCTEKEKPVIEQACFNKECDADWYFSAWSSCSKSCDAGIQTRIVRCLQENNTPSMNCREEDRPLLKQVCNLQKCPSKSEPSQKSLRDDENCTDIYSNCNLVSRTRLCSYKYYQYQCCQSCRSASNGKGQR